jgi:hypothetical protein
VNNSFLSTAQLFQQESINKGIDLSNAILSSASSTLSWSYPLSLELIIKDFLAQHNKDKNNLTVLQDCVNKLQAVIDNEQENRAVNNNQANIVESNPSVSTNSLESFEFSLDSEGFDGLISNSAVLQRIADVINHSKSSGSVPNNVDLFLNESELDVMAESLLSDNHIAQQVDNAFSIQMNEQKRKSSNTNLNKTKIIKLTPNKLSLNNHSEAEHTNDATHNHTNNSNNTNNNHNNHNDDLVELSSYLSSAQYSDLNKLIEKIHTTNHTSSQ